jgi:2-polyprenyl-3-methyl-5-hydroxy-6-metoxy-1,4-benzoquinol methylase
MATQVTAASPNPLGIFDALNAYQRSMALKAAIELDLFTQIAEGASSAAELAGKCHAAERGVRILCDYLTIQGFLIKTDFRYSLTQDSAVFLNRHSPAYMGDTAKFLLHANHLAHFQDIAGAVRKGGSLDSGNMGPEDPVWVEFAESMAALAGPMAKTAAPAISAAAHPTKVLDIAAGHGLYGIEIGLLNPGAEVTGTDWPNVLRVAVRNAEKAGLGKRYRGIPGSAFEVDFGAGYDLVLLPNFLHHFDPPTNVGLLKKVRSAMKPGGRVATLEMVPNDDRISPPPAAFSLMMLCSTPAGDAYTFRELDAMFREAGFSASTMQKLEPGLSTLVLTEY